MDSSLSLHPALFNYTGIGLEVGQASFIKPYKAMTSISVAQVLYHCTRAPALAAAQYIAPHEKFYPNGVELSKSLMSSLSFIHQSKGLMDFKVL